MDGRGPQRHQDLEDVISVIAASYDGDDEINNLDSADLPNKRAVIAAFNHIMPVLYMGFYSTRALNRTNLRYALSEHLYPAQDILVEQICRAIRYQERMGRVISVLMFCAMGLTPVSAAIASWLIRWDLILVMAGAGVSMWLVTIVGLSIRSVRRLGL